MKLTTKLDRDGTEIREGDIVCLENWNVTPIEALQDEHRIVRYRNDTFYLEEIYTFHPSFFDLEKADLDLVRVIRSTGD